MRKAPPSTVTVTRPRADACRVETATFHLSVANGPDQGSQFELDGLAASRVLVGTSPACDIRLSDPLASRRHCAFEQTGRRLRLADLGSKTHNLLAYPILNYLFYTIKSPADNK
ncbi:MAG: hypothetical protein CVU63_13690 [Deltaproteobacteria bacterium HGW-Deltaproteobacteria-20]|nr:MAG: hypothetical protein CVU63_13690 [Deltaproteobacteria bacterium HGW-Deltaproteobacteria-20]